MIYLIPAWYDGNEWREKEEYWYYRKQRSEFDETIKQLQLFRRNAKLPCRILQLAFAPNFRQFLHRQGLLRASRWSCFDCIQQVRRTRIAVLSYHNLKWPGGVEFVYTPFQVIAYLAGERYAQVEFGDNGNPILVDMYQGDKICRRNEYDDRGFLSLTTVYEDGRPQYRDYLMENGQRKMREYLGDGHVEINPKAPEYDIIDGESRTTAPFDRLTYPNISDVIREVLLANMASCTEGDIFLMAAHHMNLELAQGLFDNRNLILTFFENRFGAAEIETYRELLNRAAFLIADSSENAELLRRGLGRSDERVRDISPYDTRVDFGISPQLNVQNILMPIDGLAQEELDDALLRTAEYLRTNENARVHLFTRNAAYGYDGQILTRLERLLAANGYPAAWVREQTPEETGENLVLSEETEKPEPIRFFTEQLVDERSISKCLNEQRVILDLRDTMDVYLCVTAISKGVPRIVLHPDPYVEHGRNGFILENAERIGEALHWYLDGMEHWNEALVGCYEMSQRYTTQVLKEAWEGVLKAFE